jgi:PX domain
MQSGIASHFTDIIKIRKHEPPMINVTEPTKKGSHHEYKVSGYDHLGTFEVWRRYNHFFLLRTTLFQRFMGLYVPPIPEKKKLVTFLSAIHL